MLATFTVSNLHDSGPGSLRQAIQEANNATGADEIVFQQSVSGRLTLTTGELEITDHLSIHGPGTHRLKINGNHADRVFAISAETADVTMADLSIENGLADGDASSVPSAGGGILNLGQLTLQRVAMTNNQAIGDPNRFVNAGPVFRTAGGAVGGAIANFGTLDLRDSNFDRNQAVGADDVDFEPADPSQFPFGIFPGSGFGGAIGSFTTDFGVATATVVDSHFTRNAALAGSRGIGAFAATAGGGAIANDSLLTVTASSFRMNRAVGGDESVSPFHNGHALGGAILSGSLTPALDPTFLGGDLLVSHSSFMGNQSLGGDNNQILLTDVPRADGPNNGLGGAVIAFQGRASIQDSVLTMNQAIGGVGGAAQNGSLGVGGGVFFFNFVGPVYATVESSTLTHNAALGGRGTDGAGGDGLGGGIAVGSLGALFGQAGLVEVIDSEVAHNRAIGGNSARGMGGDGQGAGIANLEVSIMTVSNSSITRNTAEGGRGRDGGNGQGGGIYNHAGAMATVTDSRVIGNRAWAGKGCRDGSDGVGQGGGIFNDPQGVFEIDTFSRSRTRMNKASDDGDDVFGSLIEL